MHLTGIFEDAVWLFFVFVLRSEICDDLLVNFISKSLWSLCKT